MTSSWLAQHIAQITSDVSHQAPLITSADVIPIIPDLDLWDMWPLLHQNGQTASICGGTLWMILAAQKFDDPDTRHGHARIRLLLQANGEWTDCGNLFPEGLNPGSREWSGSALCNSDTQYITVFFTAAGTHDNSSSEFTQRLFQTTGTLDMSSDKPRISAWSIPVESVVADGVLYMQTATANHLPGLIKGFRDPTYFCDPQNNESYLLFTASQAMSPHACNGVIGLARLQHEKWLLQSPLISADGLCNEMERPQILFKNKLFYLFWSSSKRVFALDGPQAPTGLFGMVAERMDGPWQPLNGTGLVIANPAEEPNQAYCWYVMDDLSVASFIDVWGVQGRDIKTDIPFRRKQFGGTLAPKLHLQLDGASTRLLTCSRQTVHS